MITPEKTQPQTADSEAFRGHVALKGFFNICAEWGCSQEEMMQMLGGVSRTTLAKYQKLPYIKLSRDTLERISYIMGIYKALRLMYPTAERANRRVRLATSELPFSGTSALAFMARGSMKHLMLARRYFDAKRGWA
ncbi:MAG: DUF2384 domain-containing protein [Halomonadaceae bacterium]|nr:MAG: DUF2384 domain-containing protein [Halomonadaceae bacterium]